MLSKGTDCNDMFGEVYFLGLQACQSKIDMNQENSGPKQDNDDEEYHLHQMTTVLDDNVHNFGVDGSSDDLDVPIKVVDCPRLNLSVLGFSFIDLMCSMTRLKYREI